MNRTLRFVEHQKLYQCICDGGKKEMEGREEERERQRQRGDTEKEKEYLNKKWLEIPKFDEYL